MSYKIIPTETFKTQVKTTQKTTQKTLSILKENSSVSRKEIAAILGDITEDGVKYQLNKMKKEKMLERIGPAKGGHWKTMTSAVTRPQSDLGSGWKPLIKIEHYHIEHNKILQGKNQDEET